MAIAEIILTITALIALIAWVLFAVSYDRVRWYSSPEGRNVMTVSAGIILMILTVIINRIATLENFSYWSMSASLIIVAVAGFWRGKQLRKAQTEIKENKEN